MEILDKENNRSCQESSMRYSQIIKRVDTILWMYNILHTAGMSNVQNCFIQTLSLHGPRTVVQKSLDQYIYMAPC